MKKTLRILSVLMAALIMMGLFAACGGGEDAPQEETPSDGNQQEETGNESTQARDNLIIATANEPSSLAPYDHNATASNYMNALTYSGLMTLNIDTLDPEPMLAETVQAVSDTRWEIKLREGVKFTNGEEVTAEDAVASMEWARNEYSAYTAIYTSWWDSVEVVDKYTLAVNTLSPNAKATSNFSRIKVVPKSLIDSGNDFNANPVGCGPYKFVEWKLGDSLTFEANEDYFLGAPAIKNLTWRIIPEGSSRTIALEAGEVDFIVEVESNDMERLGSTDGITLLNEPGTGFFYMTINPTISPFNSVEFRHALNCAIDKDSVVQVALNGNGTGVYAQTSKAFSGYSEVNADKYDKELAKQYFDQSGIDPSTITFSCICSDDTKRRAGEVIQANLQEFGINMELESMDQATYLSAVQDGNYEAAIGSFTTSSMMAFIEGRFLSVDAGGSSKFFKDPTLDEMYLNALTILDDAERTSALEECAARLNEVCPCVPLYSSNNARAYNSNLSGVKMNQTGDVRWENVSWN